jgi:hypothetical protein
MQLPLGLTHSERSRRDLEKESKQAPFDLECDPVACSEAETTHVLASRARVGRGEAEVYDE